MRNMLLTYILVLSAIAASAQAVTRYVPGQYATIQIAINLCSDGDTVIVAPGTYHERINFNGRNITLTSSNPDDPSIVAATVINGSNVGSVVTFSSGENNLCRIAGFKITNGNSNYGGGIYCVSSSPTISKCIITGNKTPGIGAARGAGIYCSSSGAVITSCTISKNTANTNNAMGGGICGDGDNSLTIEKCIIENNRAGTAGASYSGRGGGLCFVKAPSIIKNCVITGNSSTYQGGGANECSASFINCVVADNYARGPVGGLLRVGPVINCTVVNNVGGSTNWPGGISSYDLVENCIVRGNLSGGNANQVYRCTVSYSNIQGGYSGTGNIDADPLLVNPAGGDYHLTIGSPCINAGDPSGDYTGQTDIDGESRVLCGRVDIGADEFPSATPATTLSGVVYEDQNEDGEYTAGEEISGAVVSTDQGSTSTTGSDGQYSLTDLTPGAMQLQVDMDGNIYRTIGVEIDEGENTRNIIVSASVISEAYECADADTVCMLALAGLVPVYGVGAQLASLGNSICEIGELADDGDVDGAYSKGVQTLVSALAANLPLVNAVFAAIDCYEAQMSERYENGLTAEDLEILSRGLSDGSIVIVTMSPVDIRILNSDGDVMELNSEGWTENQLGCPGWIFKLDGHRELALILDAEDDYVVQIVGKPEAGAGSTFGLQVMRQKSDGSQTIFTYSNVATSAQGIASVVISDGVTPTLEVDVDGDNTIDEYVLPTELANGPPVADAGPDQTAYGWIDGIAEVTLDGSGSSDPDDDELTYKWTWTIDGEAQEATGVSPTIELPIGEHFIELIVNDGTQDSEPDEVIVEVFGPVPVDDLVNISLGRVRYDRRTRQFSANVTVTNTSGMLIVSPVWLTIESISNSAVTLANSDGTTVDGKEYIDLSGLLGDGQLDPGESIATRIYFNNPTRARFTCETSVRGMISP